jgi:c(7)-type cytochrome triheme protein
MKKPSQCIVRAFFLRIEQQSLWFWDILRLKRHGKKVLAVMKINATIYVVIILLLFASSVFALPPGKTMVFDGKGEGKVVFDGPLHKAKGFLCKDCHTPPTKYFEMKEGVDMITMKDMSNGKFCGACHNGVKAFGVEDTANCARCHKKEGL